MPLSSLVLLAVVFFLISFWRLFLIFFFCHHLFLDNFLALLPLALLPLRSLFYRLLLDYPLALLPLLPLFCHPFLLLHLQVPFHLLSQVFPHLLLPLLLLYHHLLGRLLVLFLPLF